jgi:hypothetical protein
MHQGRLPRNLSRPSGWFLARSWQVPPPPRTPPSLPASRAGAPASWRALIDLLKQLLGVILIKYFLTSKKFYVILYDFFKNVIELFYPSPKKRRRE